MPALRVRARSGLAARSTLSACGRAGKRQGGEVPSAGRTLAWLQAIASLCCSKTHMHNGRCGLHRAAAAQRALACPRPYAGEAWCVALTLTASSWNVSSASSSTLVATMVRSTCGA